MHVVRLRRLFSHSPRKALHIMSRRKFRLFQIGCHIVFVLMLLAPALTSVVSAQGEDPSVGGLGRLFTLTWEGLDNPLALGLFCAAFLQLVGKGVIEWLRCHLVQLAHLIWPTLPPAVELSDDWLFRSPLYNILVFAGSYLILCLHNITGGPAFVTALLAAASAIGEYEVVKNTVRLFGGDITVLGYKWCH